MTDRTKHFCFTPEKAGDEITRIIIAVASSNCARVAEMQWHEWCPNGGLPAFAEPGFGPAIAIAIALTAGLNLVSFRMLRPPSGVLESARCPPEGGCDMSQKIHLRTAPRPGWAWTTNSA